MIEEFKKFAMKGNVMDLAVAVVIGGAFGKIVSSLVDDIIMPVVGIITGGVNYSHLTIRVGDVAIAYGSFIQSIIDFLIIALAIFFAIKALNKLKKKEAEKPAEPAKPSEEVVLLREIRDSLKK